MGVDGPACECAALGAFAVVGMGDSERQDERVFSTLEKVTDHGGEQWWLYASRCFVCGQNWMIAQDDRIHDNFYLKRLDVGEMAALAEHGDWPVDFLRFEDVIRLGPDNKQVAYFVNPDDLTSTVKELIEARRDISPKEVAYLFCLSERKALQLMKKAGRMSWAQIFPFAKHS